MSSPPDIYALDHLLAHICHLHHDRARALFETIGLYRGQPPLLRLLEEREGLSHSDLAVRLGIRPATVSKMLDRMEKAGFVSRQPDAVDQRVSRVYLTERGRAVQGQVQNLFATMAHDAFAGLSPEEVTTLYGLLVRVRDNLARVSGHQAECRGC